MSAGFNFTNITLQSSADITEVMNNFNKIEQNGITHDEATRLASQSQAGWMSQTDKSKLDGMAAGATNVTKTSDLVNDSGFINTETDPTVPAWAKTTNKPTYTFAEIQNKPTLVTQTVVGNFWKGTQAEYDAITTKDTTTLYMIIEEAD